MLDVILTKIRNNDVYFENKTKFDFDVADLEAQLDFYEEEDFRSSCSVRLVTAKVKLNSFIESHSFYMNSKPSCSNVRSNAVLLERIKLPKFAGEHKNWKEFWELFSGAVHSESSLSKIQKYNHLVSSLEGAAKLTIAGLNVTEDNYETAVQMLRSKYDDKDVLVNSYYDELDEIDDCFDGTSQRTALETVQKILNNLTTLGVEIKQDLLKNKILDKFPVETIQYVISEIEKNDGVYSVENVIKFLNAKIRITERTDLILKLKLKREEANKPKVASALVVINDENEPPKEDNMNLENKNNQNKNRRKNDRKTSYKRNSDSCIFCNRFNHKSSDCSEYNTLKKRRDVVLKKKLCIVCLEQGHIAEKCSKKGAKCLLCRKPGHQAHMCVENMIRNSRKNNQRKSKPTLTSSGKEFNDTFLETFTCRISKSRDSFIYVNVRGLLDSGSSVSYIDQKLVDQLGIKGNKNHTFGIGTFGTNEITYVKSREVLVHITNLDGNNPRFLNLRTTPSITTPNIETCPSKNLVNEILPYHLRYADKNIFVDTKEPIRLLIGNDQIYKLTYNEKLKETSSGPFLRNSIFGWIPTGGTNIDNHSNVHKPTSVLISSSTNTININYNELQIQIEKLNNMLENLWNLESIGIKENELTNPDDIALEYFRETTYIENNRYVVRWPWRDQTPRLPSNFRMCIARLRSLVEKSSSELLEKYDILLKEQLKLGIIEYAPKQTPFLIHYLPHRAIIQKEKLRVVYDASAKTKTGKSLNDLLFRGPMLLENLVGLLLNFRLHEIALTADIEKAFLQMGLNEVDRDVVRFIWLKDITKPFSFENMVILRFARVPFGVISSPSLLNLVIQDLLSVEKDHSKWLMMSKDKFYVDNLVLSVPDIDTAVKIFHSLRSKLSSVSFNLRDWTSNSIDFITRCRLPEITKNSEKISILGLNWDRYNDSFHIKLQNLNFELFVTKKIALSFAASIYDPLGLLNPSVLKLRLFIQDCWRNKFGWDEPLDANFVARWIKIIKECIDITKISIPRRYCDFKLENAKIILNIFCDASKDAYACSAYLCFTDSFGNFASSLCYSKMRVNPVEKNKKNISNQSEGKKVESNLTIPKLELLGLVLGKRSSVFLRQKLNLDISKIVLWTDSTIVLQWINNFDHKQLPKFVQNRISEINKTPNLIIRHVPGTENPADLATRGMSPSALESSSLWREGPSWICHESHWPDTPNTTTIINTITLSTIQTKYNGILTDQFEEKLRKSSWVEIIAEFEKLVENTIDFTNANSTEKFTALECTLLKELQHKYFAYEKAQLEKKLQPNNSLGLFLDDKGLIRCQGRLQNASFPWDTIHPIYVPRKSFIIDALILDIHVQNYHIGVSHLLAKIRERFWICKGRSKIKSIISYCKNCRRWEGGHFKLPPPPPLPLVRVQEASCFLHSGVDLLGPIYLLKDPCNHSSHQEHLKIYVALFTCLVTRAIHLEMVESLSGDDFLDGLKRFTARRGMPLTIISDNATNFTFVQKLVGIKVEILNKHLDDYVSSNRILWKFIPQYSPWQGGAYERLVALVKRSLKKSHGLDNLRKSEFITCLAEIENTLNSRPLTYVASDEILSPLTPNNFLRLRFVNANNYLETNYKMLDSTSKSLIKSWDRCSKVIESFWDVFRNFYLVSLRERHAALAKPSMKSVTFQPKIGDVVLIREPTAPRGEWPVGTIKKLDHRQAVAHVESENKNILIRSINLLYPLELSENCDVSSNNDAGPSRKRPRID